MADEKTHTKDDLDAAVKAAVDEAVKGLKKNLDDALDEAKEAKRKLRAASEIKPEDLTAAEERADKAEGKIKELEGSVKALTKERDAAVKNLETETGFTHKLVAENGVLKALADNGVTDPAYLEAAKAMHISQVKVVAEGDNRKAMYGDKELDAAIKEWAASDVGKKFVAAPVNGGGGAGGGGKKAAAHSMTRAAYDALGQFEKGEAGMKVAKGELTITDA